jgi:hypothetical protein
LREQGCRSSQQQNELFHFPTFVSVYRLNATSIPSSKR